MRWSYIVCQLLKMLWLVLIDLRHTDYRYADDAFDELRYLSWRIKKKKYMNMCFSFYAYMHLTMENLLFEDKINLFQSVYYGLILGVYSMT